MIDTLTLQDKYWLAGLLEGEGCFMKIKGTSNIGIALEMKDKDVVIKAASLMYNTKVYTIKSRNERWAETYKISLRGRNAYYLMRELEPIMGERRRNKIKECLDSYKRVGAGKLSDQDKISIFNMKGQNVNDIAAKFNITKWRVYQIWRGEYKIMGV